MNKLPCSASLQVVICTYNNAGILDHVLSSLASQTPQEKPRWGCLVVDNNCTDDTASVVYRHKLSGLIPNLRCELEPVQGLTAARRRGVLSTTAEWIAFVDDDCLLQRDWVRQALAFADAHPCVGAFGGKVVLEWAVKPPRYAQDYSYSFAEQHHGDSQQPVRFLAGAGLVVNRSSLLASGWIEAPLLADRVGDKLVSGGDVEIVLRIAGVGRELWYVPTCVLRHHIPESRMSLRYLIEINRNLGISQVLADALISEPLIDKWIFAFALKFAKQAFEFAHLVLNVARRRKPSAAILIEASFMMGYLQGNLRILTMASSRRRALMGRARPHSQQNLPTSGALA